jgi:hypothetical protein
MYIGTSATSPNGTFEVSVLVNGRKQPLFVRRFDGRVFVVGPHGQAYTLQVRNLTSGRIEVLNSVDGRNTLKDEPGDKIANRGMVFGSNASDEFKGFRLNNEGVRDFVFGTPERKEFTIAQQATGHTDNVGVIGFAAYRERPSMSYRDAGFEGLEVPRSFGGGATKGMTRGGSYGTEMGGYTEHRVGTTEFTRNGSVAEELVIGYASEQELRDQGIIAPPEANPFPGIGTGYAKYVQH